MTTEQLAEAIQLALYRVGDEMTDNQGRRTQDGDTLRRVADELDQIIASYPRN